MIGAVWKWGCRKQAEHCAVMARVCRAEGDYWGAAKYSVAREKWISRAA